ncbi:pantoate--beta-alanine ligase [Pseudokineococcus sp. 1T1Z-3]|uniref:pantoate--beta-alanine ligase n=1 Tax=Pseudokineococcus sp. 1T1Z-3 TaxID=3132745 RepID=UPI00403F48C3
MARARAGLGGPVATVMTMGALHEGHACLVRAARRRATSVVVTIFVNPLQFGPAEDLDRYPRTLAADLDLLADEGVDVVFVPGVEDVYPAGPPQVRVSAGALGDVLEGASRPGHFDGVLTVVAKLLALTRPDVTVFGQKDAQQLALVRRLVTDLDLGVDVVAAPTSREPDGLARSSRNAYLDGADRRAATTLSRALRAGGDLAASGAPAGEVRAVAAEVLAEEPRVDVDYLALVDPVDLSALDDDAVGPALLAVAARVGATRLIDNVPLLLGGPGRGDPGPTGADVGEQQAGELAACGGSASRG